MKSLLVLALILFTSSAQGVEPVLPVIILTVGENGTEAQHKKILEVVSQTLQKAALTVYSRETYGKGAGFRTDGPALKPIGVVFEVFHEFNREMDRQTNSGDLNKVLNEIDDQLDFSLEVIWIKEREKLGTISKHAGGVHSFAMLWQMARSKLAPDPRLREAGDLFVDMARIPLINSRDVPGGVNRLYSEGLDAYSYFREVARDKPVPLHMGFYVSARRGMVNVDFRSVVKAFDLKMVLDPPEPGDMFEGNTLFWQPPYFSDAPPLVRFSFQRNYGPDATKNFPSFPIAHITFGRMAGKDVRKIAVCNTNCVEENSAGQVHLFKSAPTLPGKIRVPTNFPSKTLEKGVQAVVDKVNERFDLYVMMSDFYFDIRDPFRMKLIEEKSRIPFIIKYKMMTTGGSKYLDVTRNRFGIDFVERFINSKASFKMNQSVRIKLLEMDQSLNEQMKDIFGNFQTLFKE